MTTHEVSIPAGDDTLPGTLTLPDGAREIIVFAHGSGSGRFSPRNREVAAALQRAGFATLLFDLLTANEAEIDTITREHRFDIALLGARLTAATDWLRGEPDTTALGIGVFGASTGAAAALVSAAARPEAVRAVVSRGGRPDLAAEALPNVASPTLLIVGGEDDVVLNLNRQAYAALRCEKKLEIIPRATHLFEEPGAMEQVADLARDWFQQHLRPPIGAPL